MTIECVCNSKIEYSSQFVLRVNVAQVFLEWHADEWGCVDGYRKNKPVLYVARRLLLYILLLLLLLFNNTIAIIIVVK